jgi:membrane-associated phospholipid phosphatase
VAFRDPRPYWTFPAVRVLYHCSRGFGNPSGHAMWCFAIPIAISLDIRRSNPHGKCMQLISIITTLWIGISIAFTRMILGVHSLDQVIFGGLIGVWIAFTFEFILRKPIMSHIRHLNKNRTEKVMPFTVLCVIASIATALVLWAEWFLYYFRINQPATKWNPPTLWEQ